MVDVSRAIAAASGNRAAERILQGTPFELRIDVGMGNRAGSTRRVIVAEGGRASHDVWLDGHTGEGRLRRQTE